MENKKPEWRKTRTSQIAEIGSLHRLALTETMKRYDGFTVSDLTCLLAINTICEDYGGYFTVYLVTEYTGYSVDISRIASKRLLAKGNVAFFLNQKAYEIDKYCIQSSGKSIVGYYVRCLKNAVESRICNYNPVMSPYAFSLLHFDTGLRRPERERLEKMQAKKRKKRNRKNPPK